MGATNSTQTEWTGEYLELNFPIGGNILNVKDLIYHTSWDWLMPVVEKIENLGYSTFTSVLSDHLGKGKHMFIFKVKFFDELGVDYHEAFSFNGKIEATYEAVIEFITWWKNEQTK